MSELKTRLNDSANSEFVYTELELKVLQMIAFECHMKKIEMEVQLTSNDLHTLLFNLYDKLGVNTRTGLIRAAFEQELLVLY